LEAQVDLDTPGMRRFGSREAWLEVDPAQHDKLIQHPALEGRVLDDARARLNVIQSDALAQGTSGAFRLNTLTLALLSVAAFWLVQFFAAQQRVLEFSVLRAMGLAVRQLLALLVTEGVLVLALGLMAGTVIGYGLSRVMIPYLSQALSGSLGGVTIKHIVVDWPTIAQLYGLLIVFYGLALALLLVVLMRVGIHQTLRMGEE
jgi:predicted lysophospholipase L1 biosynthesis ABC-type transport system permease subunit